MLEFDHIAIAGTTLDAARDHVEEALGEPLQPGGQHDVFHTHNALLGLEDGLYLEAIAINPNAPKPDRPRWFDLDRFEGASRLTNWICRTDDLDHMLDILPFDFGAPVSLQRGALRWRMAVPASGELPFDNCAPALIQWDSTPHPATQLTQQGVRLDRLMVGHPKAETLSAALAPFLSDERITFSERPPCLEADFTTRHGARRISV